MREALDLLDEYLSSDASPPESMQLSDLDGFLTGIACSPDPIAPSEWMAVIWGPGKPSNHARHRQATKLILDRYMRIVEGLSDEPSHIDPVFWQAEDGRTNAMDWCEGFIDAYTLRLDEWGELFKTPDGQDLLYPIMAHFFDDDGKSVMGIVKDEVEATLDFASEEIGNTVPLIYAFWQSKRYRLN